MLVSPTGKSVRADHSLVEADEQQRVLWRHEVEESPFERLLKESTTEIALAPGARAGGAAVTLEQRPRGWARFSPLPAARGAAARQADAALEGLAELLGDDG